MPNKKDKRIRTVVTIFVTMLVLLLVLYYVNGVYSNAREDAYLELRDFSDQAKMTTRMQMEGSVSSIIGMSNGFTGFDDIHSLKAITLLNRLMSNTNFTRMCVADANGMGIYYDGTKVDVSDRDYFKNAMKGEHGISNLLISKYSGDVFFMVYAPIYETNGSIKGVLFGAYEPAELQKVISVKEYTEGGGAYLFDREGRYITSSINPGNLKMGDDTFDYFVQSSEMKPQVAEQFFEDVAESKSGYMTYRRGGIRYTAYFQPVELGNWYIMFVVSESVITDYIAESAGYSAVLLVCFMIALVTIAVFMGLEERKRRKAEVHLLEEKQSRMAEQYANEIKNSYDAIYEFDYGNNKIYTYEFTEDGFERRDAKYSNLEEALKALEEETLSNVDVGNISEYFSEERLNRLFSSGRIELNVDVQKRKEDGQYNWFTLFLRKVHWSSDGDRIAMFYAKNVDDLYQEQRQNNQLTLDALKMAKEANRAKSDFLARMSHDIRTPMNAIMGMTAIAKSHLEDEDRVADCIGKIDSASQYLLSMINDILDMSRIESGKMELLEEEISFHEFFCGISQLMRSEAEKKNITYIDETMQEEDLYIYADKLHLQQIFMNLLSNAVKFTPVGGTVSIRADKFDESSSQVLFRFFVKDNGVGIGQDKLEKIFMPFERADADSQNGTGLGLSIAQNLITLMNGIIMVESEVGHGTVFIAEIPFRKVECRPEAIETETEADEGWQPDFSGKTVLLVEDNDINMEIAKVFLENVNLTVDPAVNGQEALEKFMASDTGHYDIIITDIRMPILGGRELTKEIRRSDRTDAAGIPIIAMSADAFSEEIQLSQSVGMNDYVTKPINPELLYKVLHKFI